LGVDDASVLERQQDVLKEFQWDGLSLGELLALKGQGIGSR
jgi:hypothetical protein